MTRQLDFPGQSGATYRYRPVEELKPVSPGGANYLFVRWEGDVAHVIYAGETDSLHRVAFDNWDQARSLHKASHVYARLNITGAVRRAEQADIVAQYKPPMNIPDAAAVAAAKPAAKKAVRKAAGPA
ncbi:MAG: hypothetical protein V4466_09930 [Pseudomonadota bacterium]